MARPLIALEEHYISSHVRSELKALGKDDPYDKFPPSILDKLLCLDENRIHDLDAGGIGIQVVSHAALDGSEDAVRGANNELAAACHAHPSRLAGFAKLPMQNPIAAADELTRCVQELHFVGALVNTHLNGTFYDDEKFWPVFARAEELDVPIYLHPTFAGDSLMPHYEGNFPPSAALAMSAFGWGWHAETGLHVLRLWASGLFDRHPKLKLIIGHMGELLPYQLDRIIPGSRRWTQNKRDLRTVWNENIWVTTSGMFSLAPFTCLLKVCSIDHILYSVDYPMSQYETGLGFLKEVEEQGLLEKEGLDAVCWANAEKLLKVKLK